MSTDIKQWISASHAANGNSAVTCTLQADSITVKWTVKTFPSTIQEGVREARKGAEKALADIQRAVASLSVVPALTEGESA